MKRTITIGDRKLSSMTEDEAADFIYRFGLCGSPHYFERPIITELEMSKARSWDNCLWIEYAQKRKLDAFTVDGKFLLSIDFDDYEPLAKNYRKVSITRFRTDHDLNSTTASAQMYCWLIANGFDVPLYDNLEDNYPRFDFH